MSQTKVKSGLLNFPDQTDFVKLPSGTTAQRPSSPEKGYSRYNTTDNKLEFWDGTKWEQLPGIVPPIITSISYPGDDLAADPAGGQTITINGGDFKSGATVNVDGTIASVVTVVSANEITFTAPDKAAGDYDIVVTNTDGGNATLVDGITYNGLPSWTTPAGKLGGFGQNETIPTITLVATEPDSGLISYSITNGVLPTGLSLTGNTIDGTTPSVSGDTTYNFTVTANDNENQSTERSFNIIVYRVGLSFNTVLYTGNGGTESITGVGFQPDLVWIKNRDNAYSYQLYDSVRGVGSSKNLQSDNTKLEGNDANLYGYLSSFDADGYTVQSGTNATVGDIWTNDSGVDYVVWCWKAGGAAVTNTDGSITSQVSANIPAGFSIMTYTGNGSSLATIGHGLESTPEIIIVKGRNNSVLPDGGSSWPVWHKALTSPQYSLLLNENGAESLVASRFESLPNNQIIHVGASGFTNNTGSNFVSYCFHSVPGFSKIDSYTGNGPGGQTIYTTDDGTSGGSNGFEPAFVMIKRIDSSSSWIIADNKRVNGELLADVTDAERIENTPDFISNGFTFTTERYNDVGSTWIYMAFANQF